MISSARLDTLLSETVSAARIREDRELDATMNGSSAGLVLFGAGGLGRKIAAALRSFGIVPAAFSDNHASLWGKRVEGLEVLSPPEAVRRYGERCTFVVTIWHPEPYSAVVAVQHQLRRLGCRRIATFPLVMWKYAGALLPLYLWDLPSKLLAEADEIRAAFELFDESASQAEFLGQLRLRLWADFAALPPPCPSPQYFPEGVFQLHSEECFIDCGAYVGDTIRSFVDQNGGRFRRIVAFEPDPENFAQLERMLLETNELRVRAAAFPMAVAAESGIAHFDATGNTSAAIASSGKLLIPVRTLDELLDGETPTFLKMDVEGAEYDALRGATRVVRQHKPLLAVCAYHRPQDLWRIPRLLHELVPDARLILRPHCADGFDLVCYAVPPARCRELAKDVET